jgi:hypothetical protein
MYLAIAQDDHFRFLGLCFAGVPVLPDPGVIVGELLEPEVGFAPC